MHIVIKNRCKFDSTENYVEYLRNLKNSNPDNGVVKDIYFNALEEWADELLKDCKKTTE